MSEAELMPENESEAEREARHAAEEEAIAAQMSPELEEIPADALCGGCGAERSEWGEHPVIRAAFREGEDPWVRCTACKNAWLAERRREEALEIPETEWRWLRVRYDGPCAFCGELVEAGSKARIARGQLAHASCLRRRSQLRLV